MQLLPFVSFTAGAFSTLWLILFLVVELIWLASIVSIARQKTPDPFDRIVWLLIVLALNIFGTILYALFSPMNVIDPNRYSPYPRSARYNPSRRDSPRQNSAQHNPAPEPSGRDQREEGGHPTRLPPS